MIVIVSMMSITFEMESILVGEEDKRGNVKLYINLMTCFTIQHTDCYCVKGVGYNAVFLCHC